MKVSDKQKPMNFLESISMRLNNARISERKIKSRQKYLTIDINKIASEISMVQTNFINFGKNVNRF